MAKSFMYLRIRMRSSWNFTYFIAQKLQKRSSGRDVHAVAGEKREAKPIRKIATISISLAMIVNIVTIAVVNGFQQEVSRKVIGFGSHISIQKHGEGTLMESAPIQMNADFPDILRGIKGVSSLQSVAYKPALLQSSSKVEQREILGIILKGVPANYDWLFFEPYVKAGKLPSFRREDSNEILISKRIATDLHFGVGDTVNAYFVKQRPIQRQFRVVGIYETGLEDFDKELAFCSLAQVQQLNDWGIQAEIVVDDTLANGQLIIRGVVNGGNGNFRYDWGKGYEAYGGFTFCPTKDTTIRLIASDYWMSMSEPSGRPDLISGETALPDTAYLEIKIRGNEQAACNIQCDREGTILREFLDDEGYRYSINAGGKQLEFHSIPGNGSFQKYIGAYEVSITDIDQLDEVKKRMMKAVMLNPDFQQQVQVKSIKDLHEDLFVWLGFLDINMLIIIVLMLIIGIVNMGSALLVIILVRTNFIGIMKAMGAKNGQLRKIFLAHVGSMIVRGMIWGNLIGFGLCLAQDIFHIIPLDPKVYYLNSVPISLSWWMVIVLNATTIIVCLLALFIPSILISRISPSKSIRFR